MNIEHTDIQVMVGHSTSSAIQVITGLRQGDALFPILFNLALEKAIKSIRMDEEGNSLGK